MPDQERWQCRSKTQSVPQINCAKRQEVLQVVPPEQKIPLVQSDVAVHDVLGKQWLEYLLMSLCVRLRDSPRDPTQQVAVNLQEVEEEDHVDQSDGINPSRSPHHHPAVASCVLVPSVMK